MTPLAVSLVTINAAVCACLFLTCFSRVHKMDHNTRNEIRFSTILVGVAALAAAAAPFVWGFLPTPPQVVLEAAFLLIQLVTGRLWAQGVPRAYQVDPRGARHA